MYCICSHNECSFSSSFQYFLGGAFITLLYFLAKKETMGQEKNKACILAVHTASLAIQFLQLKLAGRLSFPKLMLHSLCEGKKVNFELSILWNEFIIRVFIVRVTRKTTFLSFSNWLILVTFRHFSLFSKQASLYLKQSRTCDCRFSDFMDTLKSMTIAI